VITRPGKEGNRYTSRLAPGDKGNPYTSRLAPGRKLDLLKSFGHPFVRLAERVT